MTITEGLNGGGGGGVAPTHAAFFNSTFMATIKSPKITEININVCKALYLF